MNTTTERTLEDKITSLPKWAQEHINKLEMQRDAAVESLNQFVDQDTESPFWFESHPCTGESRGPSFKKCYVQTNHIEVQHNGVYVSVMLRDNIEISWSTNEQRVGDHVCMVPTSFQQIELINRNQMRHRD